MVQAMSFSSEATYLLRRAQTQGYITSDGRDEFDAIVEAYQAWCRAGQMPFLHISYGDTTARVVYSLLEADALFPAATEEQLRSRVPTFCLRHADLEIEDDYLIAGRVLNEFLPALLEWLTGLTNDFVEAKMNRVGGQR